ncbi:hypothetical protein TNCV_3685021 [Trichonephila clavipes]|uniref:Uncharacterized protein n=1 Tax=Trichonephila clavipes TaxID=2585209 RepID=A0A8X6RIY2_TRICX|nr:hypothetical protein TNCV_3685021 [Trichonephila clavipes]
MAMFYQLSRHHSSATTSDEKWHKWSSDSSHFVSIPIQVSLQTHLFKRWMNVQSVIAQSHHVVLVWKFSEKQITLLWASKKRGALRPNPPLPACQDFEPSTAEELPCRRVMHVKSVEAQISSRWCGVKERTLWYHTIMTFCTPISQFKLTREEIASDYLKAFGDGPGGAVVQWSRYGIIAGMSRVRAQYHPPCRAAMHVKPVKS